MALSKKDPCSFGSELDTEQRGQSMSVQRIGNPGPLGLLCFGMTTVMLMFLETGWAEDATISAVLCYALFYGGISQIVAAIFELVKGNTFAGTAFFSYGSFWLAFATIQILVKVSSVAAEPAAFEGASHYRVGQTLILCLWGVFTIGLFVPTLRKNGCLVVAFGSLTVTFFLLAAGVWSKAASRAAGYVGFFCGCSAIYAAFAEIWHEDLGIQLPGIRPVRFI